VRHFDDDRVLALCRSAKDQGMDLPDLLQRIIYPVMQRVGAWWERALISTADEHRITALINRVLAELYFDQPFPAAIRGTALVATGAHELHEMGAWMLATCLELDGWDVHYLGANVPGHEVLAKAIELQPRLIALSVSMPFNLGGVRETVAELKTRLPQTRVMIGGQVFQWLPRLVEGIGADRYLEDCQRAVQWARRWSVNPHG
jgi:methanogenic corrinoid protein MtbC1